MTGGQGLVLDVMLGRLARWLRAAGYDTLFDPRAADADLIRTSVTERRLLLTGDRRLAATRRPGLITLLVASRTHAEQLEEVARSLGEPSGPPFSRCLVCNRPLDSVAPAAVAGSVPDYVLQTHRAFSCCASCNRVFWRGTHRRRMETVLSDLGLLPQGGESAD